MAPRSAPTRPANFAGSTAIGVNASTTAANQMMLGTATTTYAAPGITSAASLAAQSGPTSFVTSDAAGHLAVTNLNFNPQAITALSANIGALQQNVGALQQSVGALQRDVQRGFEGAAVALAMGGVTLPAGKNYAVSFNWGNFAGQNAAALAAQVRITDNLFFN